MANLYRVRVASRGWVGNPGLNTLYFAANWAEGQVGHDNAVLCADRVHAAFTELKNMYPQAWRGVVDSTVDVIEDTTGELQASESVDGLVEITGIAVSGWQGIALSLCAQLRTATITDGHRLRGRAFLGPVAEQQDTDGSPNADQAVKVAAWAAALLDNGLDGPDLAVWHRPRAAQPEATPPVTARDGGSAIVSTITMADKYAVLRSRRG